MKFVVALFMGLCSGVMIYFMAAMTFMDMSAGSGPSGAFVAISFLGGWALSTWLLLRGAISVSDMACIAVLALGSLNCNWAA